VGWLKNERKERSVSVLIGESENKSTKRRTVDDNVYQKRFGRRDAVKPKTVQSVSQLLQDGYRP
jgi:hypothetical protein